MPKGFILSALGAAALAAGCGGIPPTHLLTLLFPIQNCHVTPSPCVGFLGCYNLGISKLTINVSSAHSSEDSNVLCNTNAASSDTTVYYQPNQDFYLVSAGYIHNNSVISLSSGPFTEDQTKTPWTLAVH